MCNSVSVCQSGGWWWWGLGGGAAAPLRWDQTGCRAPGRRRRKKRRNTWPAVNKEHLLRTPAAHTHTHTLHLTMRALRCYSTETHRRRSSRQRPRKTQRVSEQTNSRSARWRREERRANSVAPHRRTAKPSSGASRRNITAYLSGLGLLHVTGVQG